MAQKRRKRKPLDIADIRASMSTAIQELENIFMDTTNEADTRIRAINSLGTTAVQNDLGFGKYRLLRLFRTDYIDISKSIPPLK